MTPITPERYLQLSILAGQVFNPNTPVSEKDMFSGRINQIRRVLDAIFQKGQHVIIFGERGVGKTSLANVLSSFVPAPTSQGQVLAIRINCDREDTFTSVWTKVFNEMNLIGSKHEIGFAGGTKQTQFSASHFFKNKTISPDEVRVALVQVSINFLPVIIIDEFDRMQEGVRKLFADLIKNLSDHSVDGTIVLIGVGDSVQELIQEHQSVSRALVQVPMPRMIQEEIKAIIINSLSKLSMTIEDETLNQISLLSKGLPHYTHLIGLHAARNALDSMSFNINNNNLKFAIKKSIEDAQHSIKTNYHDAIRSARKDNLFAQVLLSCAIAKVNDLGEFAAQDLREPMLKITGKTYNIPAYAQHLNEFSESKRGKILIKSGEKKRFRYKFSDPLMQPFVIMQGIIDERISNETLLLINH